MEHETITNSKTFSGENIYLKHVLKKLNMLYDRITY